MIDELVDRWQAAWVGRDRAAFAPLCTPDVHYEDPLCGNPLEGPDAARSRDLVDGEKLALREQGGLVNDFTVNFRSVNSAEDGEVTTASAAAAARKVAQDPGAIAAIGALSEVVVIRRLRRAPPVMSIVGTLGLASFLLLLSLVVNSQASAGRLFPQPAFVYTNNEPEYFQRIKIKSPNNGLHLGQGIDQPLVLAFIESILEHLSILIG